MKEAPPPHRLRRLSDEEIALWTEVARSRLAAARGEPARGLEAARAEGAGSADRDAAAAPEPRPAKPRALPLAPIERRLKRELARGRGAIDGAIDLHGMTQAEAHQALRGFLRHSQARGRETGDRRHRQGRPARRAFPVGRSAACCAGSRPTGCANPTCARSCSASRRRDAPTAAPARSMCGSGGPRQHHRYVIVIIFFVTPKSAPLVSKCAPRPAFQVSSLLDINPLNMRDAQSHRHFERFQRLGRLFLSLWSLCHFVSLVSLVSLQKIKCPRLPAKPILPSRSVPYQALP